MYVIGNFNILNFIVVMPFWKPGILDHHHFKSSVPCVRQCCRVSSVFSPSPLLLLTDYVAMVCHVLFAHPVVTKPIADHNLWTVPMKHVKTNVYLHLVSVVYNLVC